VWIDTGSATEIVPEPSLPETMLRHSNLIAGLYNSESPKGQIINTNSPPAAEVYFISM